MHDSIVVPIMKTTLPHELIFTLSRTFDEASEVWEMHEWIDELWIKIEARKRIGETKSRSNRSSDNQRDRSTTSSLFIDQRKTCVYCK